MSFTEKWELGADDEDELKALGSALRKSDKTWEQLRVVDEVSRYLSSGYAREDDFPIAYEMVVWLLWGSPHEERIEEVLVGLKYKKQVQTKGIQQLLEMTCKKAGDQGTIAR